jgi:hypothetical protein
MRPRQRWLVNTALVFACVCLAFLLGEGHGLMGWILTFVVGLGIGFANRGPWSAGLIGVIAAQVVVGLIQESFRTGTARTPVGFAGDGLLLAIVMFTPGYLFGAAARRGPGPPAVPAAPDPDPAAAGGSSKELLSSGQMVFVGCAILTVFGLLMGYLLWQLTKDGGY